MRIGQSRGSISPRPPDDGDSLDHSLEARWTKRLAKPFIPLSTFFVENYHRLGSSGSKRLSSTQVMILIHLVAHKWDARAPYPALSTLAERMDISVRAVREAVRQLEEKGFLLRVTNGYGGPNRYDLSGLFNALEALMDRDIASRDAAEETKQAQDLRRAKPIRLSLSEKARAS